MDVEERKKNPHRTHMQTHLQLNEHTNRDIKLLRRFDEIALFEASKQEPKMKIHFHAIVSMSRVEVAETCLCLKRKY